MARAARTWVGIGLSLALPGLLACTAEIVGPSGQAGGAGSGPPGPGTAGAGTNVDPGATPCDPNLGLAPPRLWRLNDQQYQNVVHDLFGTGVEVPPDVSAAHVAGSEEATNAAGLAISDVATAQNYFRSAAGTAHSAAMNLAGLFPCAAVDATCVETFIRTKVARAFRRPVTDQQVTDMLSIYQLGASDGPSAGAEALLRYVLLSPWFLWRTELPSVDASAGPQPLDAFDLASALAFLFLDSTPDDALWSRAADGSLAQPAVLEGEVERLMALPVVKANLANKIGSWLSIHKTEVTVKDPRVFPEFTSAVQTSLTQSVQLFLSDMAERGGLLDLVTSNRLYLNQDLAALYGIDGVTGSALVPIDVPGPHWAGGILTQPALLAANSRSDKGDPIHRGLFIYNSMVCGATLPPPPPNAISVDSSLPADASERARASFRESRPDCTPCHGRFDPLGLLSERYDPIGRYRESDASGQPIDQSSTIALGGALDGPADGLLDLVARLKSSRQFSDCASSKLAGISLGRVTTGDNSCALRSVQDAFAQNPTFSSLFKAIATSPAFATRDGRVQ